MENNLSELLCDRMSHAYIADSDAANVIAMAAVCSGTDSVPKPCKRCKDCLKAANGNHPDIITIGRLKDKSGKPKREIIVGQIRALKKGGNVEGSNIESSYVEGAFVLPNEASRKAYIIRDADTMNTIAQNAFLNLLEEPPPYVVFILSTSNPDALLPTVRSRCIERRSQALSIQDAAEEEGEAAELADCFVSALGDNVSLTKCMFRLDGIDKSVFAVFLALTRGHLAAALRKDPHNKDAVVAEGLLIDAAEMLELNVNIGHISGMLCAKIMKGGTNPKRFAPRNDGECPPIKQIENGKEE